MNHVESTRRNVLNSMMHEVAELNVEKGWRNTINSFAEYVALLHSEASETLEAWRDFHDASPHYTDAGKPVGVPSELADAFIRLLDMCSIFGVDLYAAYKEKMEYGHTRPYQHGGRTL